MGSGGSYGVWGVIWGLGGQRGSGGSYGVWGVRGGLGGQRGSGGSGGLRSYQPIAEDPRPIGGLKVEKSQNLYENGLPSTTLSTLQPHYDHISKNQRWFAPLGYISYQLAKTRSRSDALGLSNRPDRQTDGRTDGRKIPNYSASTLVGCAKNSRNK